MQVYRQSTYYNQKINVLILLFLGIFLFGCQESVSTDPKASLEEMANQVIKDRRVELFDTETEIKNGQTYYTVLTTNQRLRDSIQNYYKNQKDYQVEVNLLPLDNLKTPYGLVNVSTAHMRKEARHSSELVTQALMGTPLKILQQKGNWWRIQTPDLYIGWMHEDQFQMLDKQQMETWKKSERLLFTGFSGRIYQFPNAQSKPISDIVMGALLQKGDKIERGYQEVILPDQRSGWIDNYYLTNFEEVVDGYEGSTPASLIYIGEEMMGVPYLWGGTSAKGLDCSGFTKTIFWMNGILLPRDASQQVHTGLPVTIDDSLSQLYPGDLIFFGRKRSDGSDKITHVALHLGEGEIIHATGKVKIESLNPQDSLYNESRRESVLQVRRYLEQDSILNTLSIKSNSWYL